MKIVIENHASAELGVMLEPWCEREDIPPGRKAQIEFEPNEDAIQIDLHDDTFLSLWVAPGATLTLID